ncbi:hypothetical protein [Alienimonas chondri]|uniref:Uncharacterized protein n=1 Tax=Alienimonas chondri TaxID=2681879 RepID=A0ABX1VD73_9PLAN|nr:hypothetical protein [Alienimonas chondri]NNJ25253.1 hypothetical protein [Alienimonas chondri]
MTITAHVLDGRIVSDEPIELPDGTALLLHVVPGKTQPTPEPANDSKRTGDDAGPPTLLDSLADVVGRVDDLPPDAASAVDETLYGSQP